MRLETSNLLVQFWSELEWLSDLAAFVKPPPGVCGISLDKNCADAIISGL